MKRAKKWTTDASFLLHTWRGNIKSKIKRCESATHFRCFHWCADHYYHYHCLFSIIQKSFSSYNLFFFFFLTCSMDSMVHISRWADEEESVGNMQERWVSVPDCATHYPHRVIKTRLFYRHIISITINIKPEFTFVTQGLVIRNCYLNDKRCWYCFVAHFRVHQSHW